jgi:putative ABC transport system ATP-binding protein
MLSVRELHRDYRMGARVVHALRGVSFEVEAGTFLAVMGPSGSGKSTLLHLVGALDRPSSGAISIDGVALSELDDRELTLLRRRKLGFIFQFFNLLPSLAAWENVALPRLLDGAKLAEVRPRAIELLERFGLEHRVDHRPSQLSGGEMQRVAIARALVADPVLLLADEPTGNLDTRTGHAVLELLRSVVEEEGKTLVLVTHDARAASLADRVLELEDGRLVRDSAPVRVADPGSLGGLSPDGAARPEILR